MRIHCGCGNIIDIDVRYDSTIIKAESNFKLYDTENAYFCTKIGESYKECIVLEDKTLTPSPCDRCNQKEELISLVISFGGGKEKRWLLCKFCIALIELTIRGSKGEDK